MVRITKTMQAKHLETMTAPFAKTGLPSTEQVQPGTPSTPSTKGKEKAYFHTPLASTKSAASTVYANDLVSLVKGGSGISGSPTSQKNGANRNSSSSAEPSWDQWGDVRITYYPKHVPDIDAANTTQRTPSNASPAAPVTPTPIRRSSNLGPHGQRASRPAASDESPSNGRSPNVVTEATNASTAKVIEIPYPTLKSSNLHTLLQEYMPDLSPELRYELLSKLRVASALTTSLETRRQMLSIRLLAITNLAYIHSETAFLENVLKQDADEPRRLQITYQLAEMIHPPADGDIAIPRPLQTLALSALEALSSHQTKFTDVCSALNTNINHGVLLYVVRKAVAGMAIDSPGDHVIEEDEWRDAVFSLLHNLSMNPRIAGELVAAGLVPILVEILGFRTDVAERYHPTIIQFLDNIMYSVRDSFQTLVNAEGLDAVSNLIVFEVNAAAENARAGRGIRPEYRSVTVDYEIPFYQQQTLKWLFKFIHHMMSAAGAYGANYDRLLRNLIDSSQLLASLREIIGNSSCFGSIVWTNSVSILNDFINNEPTSFAIIAEAGLSKGFLEAVTCTEIPTPSETKKAEDSSATNAEIPVTSSTPAAQSDDDDDDDTSDDEPVLPAQRPSLAKLQQPREGRLAQGILPTSETINVIPQAFGAICLNNAGMKMFQSSRALESFFEIFESPEHVKCMETNKDLPSSLGGTFDELVRHHPPLKTGIMNAILTMVARVGYLCKTKAERQKIGAKLWTTDFSGKSVIADWDLYPANQTAKGKGKAIQSDDDVDMQDVDTAAVTEKIDQTAEITPNASLTPYISAVSTFLLAMLSNSSVRSEFCSKGGIEYLLDLADSPCLSYDFGEGSASRNLHSAIALVAEPKPHLTIPSLLRRAQVAADVLTPFAIHKGDNAFFAAFVNGDARTVAPAEFVAQGTAFAKAFVNLQSLISTIQACFHATAFNHRSASTSFNQINVADYYVRLVESLGLLLGASLREDMLLVKRVPESWKNAGRIKDSGFGEPAAGGIGDGEPPSLSPELSNVGNNASDSAAPAQNGNSIASPDSHSPSNAQTPKASDLPKFELNSPYFKNFQILHYLLGKMSRTVSPFFQTLGKALVIKRSPEGYQKQSHSSIAKALADSLYQELSVAEAPLTRDKFSYWNGVLSVLKEMLIDVSRHNERPVQIVTIVLQAFKEAGGLKAVNKLLEIFTDEIRFSDINKHADNLEETTDQMVKFDQATTGTKNILTLYSQIVSGKILGESQQTTAMTSRNDRDRIRSEHFSPSQFLVEIRMEVLPLMYRLWQSDLIEKGSSQISEKLIEVIRTVSNADGESGASKRSDPPQPSVKATRKLFKVAEDHVASMIDQRGIPRELAVEALYRCNNNLSCAVDYCREITDGEAKRNPIPEDDLEPVSDTTPSRPLTGASSDSAAPGNDDQSIETDRQMPGVIGEGRDGVAQSATSAEASTATADVQLVERINSSHDDASTTDTPMPDNSTANSQLDVAASEEASQVAQVTIDDLNEIRESVRKDLIDKCLDVIRAHGDITFEVSDLISIVVKTSEDPSAQRKNVGETLIIALTSFAGEDDLRTVGSKIAAYANLLALMLRDKEFYSDTIDDLKENLSGLLNFVRLSPTHSSEDPSPWIPQILLVVEMLLSEDARPRKTKWAMPKEDSEQIESPVLEAYEPAISQDQRKELLDSILDILPRIGKDESLALAVLRTLVILTRNRSIAQTMGEKKNIQRLFVMAKQLAGASGSRIQGPLMLILRHIIEDEATIRQIMRADIKTFFETARQQRAVDTTNYLRGLAHTAIRSPELFVDVTNEMVKYNRWQFSQTPGAGPSRHVSLVLKEATNSDTSDNPNGDGVSPTLQATEDLSIQDVKTSTEAVDSEMPDVAKPSVPENKLPVLENPDGVIHFLLCELLNYKDVEDKDPPTATTSVADKPATSSSINEDVPMDGTSAVAETPAKDSKSAKPSGKQEFKPEEHPIYIYRCFILQCLTELLSSYNRTKLEFINFKRSAPPQAMTPSKPRSSVVNYLLSDLIPIGTLDHAETTVLRKKVHTSGWADSVLVALLNKTGEHILDNKRQPWDIEDEPDLLFVRKFVLENILKAYKEASSSTETLDVKYARMLALSDLMAHVMSGKESAGSAENPLAAMSHKQLKRIMFEKGYITALTASIADIDLNFPGAKRAIKYILRPLKTLSNTAVLLSDLGLVTNTSGQTEEDEIESATSVSDGDDREETPDLFRNSALGIFEPGRDEDSSSASDDDADDEEMYQGEYDEEMDYEEEEIDAEDNISDEDEEIEGMGPIEGLSGDNVAVEVIMEDEDDEDDEDDDEGSSDEDEEDSEDEEARAEILDELEDGEEIDADDMDDWESDNEDDNDAEEDYEAHAAEHDEHDRQVIEDMQRASGQLGHIVRALGGEDAVEIMERMEEQMEAEGIDPAEEDDEHITAEYGEEGDEEDDEEEDEDMDDDEMVFDQGFTSESKQCFSVLELMREVEVDGPGGAGFQFEAELERPMVFVPRQRPRAFPNMPFFPGNPRDPLGGINRNGQAIQFHITTGPDGEFPRDFQAMFGMPPIGGPGGVRAALNGRREPSEPSNAASFTAQTTNTRWLEEAKMLFGSLHLEKANDLVNAIHAVLIPPAIEADKVQKAAKAEFDRKLKEETEKKAEEERIAREAKEAEEKAEQEKKLAEERETAEREEAEARAARGPEVEPAEDPAPDTDAMDGVEVEQATAEATGDQPGEDTAAADRPRITTIIRGNPFDITDLGIDAEFLAELPEEIREEVIMSAVAERRSQAAATGAQPSEIDQEFLDALPDDIREEIIQQERQDRRRREREERNRQNAAAGGPTPDMDPASILATLPPALRNQVLMEQDDEILALLPNEMANQARQAQRDLPSQRAHHTHFNRRTHQPATGQEVDIQRPVRKATVQMLDKSGIATLLRLMFIFQQGSLRSTLNSVLQNISNNRQNRNEVLSTILHILQDGSFDMTAVERSFAQLTLRAKQSKDKDPKTPQPFKRTLTGTSVSSVLPANFDASPLMVVQQCLTTLVYLIQVNLHIPAFFLTEHEPGTGLKRSISRKGKGKDNKAAKYPLNSLLSLLDRQLIMDSSTVMESLSTLLNMTTSPLQALQRKQKEASEDAKAAAEVPPLVTEPVAPTETNEPVEGAQTPSAQPVDVSIPEASDNSNTETQTPAATTAEADAPTTTAGADASSSEAKDVAKEPEKKQRTMVPPVIPEHNLKLVINIFVARECSSKTFRETLSTIKNLSAIPGAKAVFGRELISKAQGLGEIILDDLQNLLPQIEKALTGTEIQGVALAKFSPGGSDQNKLLRVLTALDHLFDPKRDKKEDADDVEGESSQLSEKQDLLSSLYENSTFGPMWEKLSECLQAIRQREHLLNVATILLPLIEALMVVCKNTTLKDTTSRTQAGKEMMLTSPPPESRMESLFFTFTEEHRKILNDLVRHTPKLMSGTFSLLVKNPKVLEFDNKRNYFNRSVHTKSLSRQSFPTLQLSVRRDQVFHDSFKSLYFQTGDQMKYGKLSIRFHGEEGVDAGGVTREWFQVLSRQMFDPGYALFIPVSSDRTTFHPNQLSSINEEHLMFFKFIGRIIGKALYEGRVLDCHFSRAVYKRILGKPVSVKDMESLDPDYYKSLVWMLENDITDIITETFSVDNDKFGVVETIDFIENGRNIPVTEENKHEYVRLMVEWRLTGSVKEQLDEFLKGKLQKILLSTFDRY
ncbi:putative E3 ubiquitin-protein ligase TOM1-like protein [Glarea lozoyensis 74030]|uniref:HECT-type E3 ubiquitin transferase n=1 Tax=Glarea lozoyensis (strain ATCC 74030 / MF5533) TaxID=1104152 RepID=H0ETD0_GLAL7|nr:putative E3 ubiquitin-protein ligase TOM1-like protein [Glarea lozoyensis 74030]